MTYFYYQTSTLTNQTEVTEERLNEWRHLSNKGNWRITQLSSGYYQTEASSPLDPDAWVGVTRRISVESAEAAIEDSVEHFTNKLESTKGPKVIKTF